jgi:hypothetical protein
VVRRTGRGRSGGRRFHGPGIVAVARLGDAAVIPAPRPWLGRSAAGAHTGPVGQGRRVARWRSDAAVAGGRCGPGCSGAAGQPPLGLSSACVMTGHGEDLHPGGQIDGALGERLEGGSAVREYVAGPQTNFTVTTRIGGHRSANPAFQGLDRSASRRRGRGGEELQEHGRVPHPGGPHAGSAPSRHAFPLTGPVQGRRGGSALTSGVPLQPGRTGRWPRARRSDGTRSGRTCP